MNYYLVGSSGRLGRAIAKEFFDEEIQCLDRSIYRGWECPSSVPYIRGFFDTPQNKDGATIFVASGLLDPTLSRDELLFVNYYLPKNIIDAVSKIDAKVITFGTVLEGLLSTQNNYVQSKTFLNEYVKATADECNRVLHVQLHTLYGLGQPSPFMFLGQILSALREDAQFKMTSGRQLREYHHFLDVTKAVRHMVNSSLAGVVNLSHGKPVSLRDIANRIFEAFDKDYLLQVGAIPEPLEENYDRLFQPIELCKQVCFRDSLPSIIDYMRECFYHDLVAL